MTQEVSGGNITAQPKGPSRWKKIASKLSIPIPILLMMVKYASSTLHAFLLRLHCFGELTNQFRGAIPPTIGLAMYALFHSIY
jgi:hypothetical protein